MTDHTNERQPWRPTLRLWHLFAITALAAVLAWLWPRWGVEFRRVPGQGSRLIVLWEGDRTTVWDTFERKTAPVPPRPLTLWTARSRVSISPDGRWLVTGSQDGTVRLRELNTPEDPAASPTEAPR